MFSRIAESLHRHSAMTIPELLQLITNCYSPSPEPEQVEFLYDITRWIAPHIEDVKHHIYPHSFKFAKDHSGKVGMWYKQWAKDDQWLPEEGPLYILKSIPKGTPPVIRPLSKRLPSVEDMTSKLEKSSCRMTTNEIAWWRKFLKAEESYRKKWEAVSEANLKTVEAENWPLLRLGKHFKRNEIEGARSVDAEEQHMEEQLNKLLNRQDRFPQVNSWLHSFLNFHGIKILMRHLK